MYNAGNINDPCNNPSILNKLKLKNVNIVVIGHYILILYLLNLAY